jgi:FkbM family methyltransferase
MAIRTDLGYLLAPPEDLGLTLALLETHGSLEPGTTAVLSALALPGGTVIDVGANVGALTLPAARRVGPTGRVLSLEPAPRVADLLTRTVRMHGLSWVEVHPVAAGDVDGVLRFNLSAQTTHNSVLPLDDVVETIEIPSRRLDTLVAPGERVDLVKIDVEGAELQVWRGMQRIVGDNPDIALILEFGPEHLRKSGQSVAGWFEALQSTGLKAWEIDEATATVRPLRRDGLAEVYSVNILLLRGSPDSRGLNM